MSIIKSDKVSGINPVSNVGKVFKNNLQNGIIAAASNFLVNGFANPLAVDGIIQQLRDPNLYGENTGIASFKTRPKSNKLSPSAAAREVNNSDYYGLGNKADGIKGGYNPMGGDKFSLKMMYLKPNTIRGYYSPGEDDNGGKRYLVPRRLKVRIIEKVKGVKPLKENVIGYRVKVVDKNAPDDIALGNTGNELIVQHSDIYPDPKNMFISSVMGLSLFASDPTGLIDFAASSLATERSLNLGIPNEAIDFVRFLYASDTSRFMRPELNPIVRAYETTKGRGLAGTLGRVQFKWLDESFPWETDHNARAPLGVTISLTLNVIHDIPPGLDHTGFNRAPLYNVGGIMKEVSGDVYSDDGAQSEFNFRKEGGVASRVKGGRN